MAKKAAPGAAPSHGFSDIIGILLGGFAMLLLISLLSYQSHDVAEVATPPNNPVHNLIGPFGAWMAYKWLLWVGVSAFLLPFILMFVALGCFFDPLAYLRRRWLWAVLLFMCFMGMMDLYSSHFEGARIRLGVPPGGILGHHLNETIFNYFGLVGATIIFAMLDLISILYLTNFRLGEWLRSAWPAIAADAASAFTNSSEAAEGREKDSEKKKSKPGELPDKVDKSDKADKSTPATVSAAANPSGLGADGQPVPEPTVRDLSVPQSKPGAPKAKKALDSKEPAPPEEVVVVPARELAAATAGDILGRKTEANAKTPESGGPRLDAEGKPIEDPDDVPLPIIRSRPQPRRSKPITVASTPLIGNYQLPSMDFLQPPDTTIRPTESKEELVANARLMQQTLAQFDIEVALGDITKGPTITRYELHPAPGVKLEKIAGLNNNIAAALKAERLNILAPIPGKSSVGVEVPNLVKTKVIMHDLLDSDEWKNSKARIPLALGKDVYGLPIIADLAEMPHLLIAGSTGSGKSVCINAIVASLLYKFSPENLRFVMIDPKVVELQQYNTLPHLVVPVVTDPKKVILALRWVVNEMEKRYQIFAKVGVRNIRSFNDRPKNKPVPVPEPELPLAARKEKGEPGAEGFAVEVDEQIVVPREDDIIIPEKLSYIVVIIDELADLMLVAPADVEMAIARITQMARAAGIHCIVATQRPSVDVITGVIKANIPARIAFQVAAKVDSRTILDAMGADKLLGKGDMLYLPPGSAKLIRAQGVLITDQEIEGVVNFISKQGKPSYEVEIHKELSKPAEGFEGDSGCDEDEDLIQQCIEVIRSEQKASVSLMQRRLRLGYTRAARIMDELENRGIVGPSKGAEPRDILIDLDGEGADGGGTSTGS